MRITVAGSLVAMFVAITLSTGCSIAGQLADPPATAPIGTWLFQNKRFAIEIDPCGDRLCAKITWLQAPRDSRGLMRVDSKNPDPKLRSQPVLGLTILSGLRHTSGNKWEDGQIYNPEDGNCYNASMSMNDDHTIRIRAYLGVPLFGKTLSLTRQG